MRRRRLREPFFFVVSERAAVYLQLQLKEVRTLIRVDKDAACNGAGRLPNLAPSGKDPLAVQAHFHNMFYGYAQAAPRDQGAQ